MGHTAPRDRRKYGRERQVVEGPKLPPPPPHPKKKKSLLYTFPKTDLSAVTLDFQSWNGKKKKIHGFFFIERLPSIGMIRGGGGGKDEFG